MNQYVSISTLDSQNDWKLLGEVAISSQHKEPVTKLYKQEQSEHTLDARSLDLQIQNLEKNTHTRCLADGAAPL